MSALKAIFWGSAGLLVYTQAGYPLLLAGLARVRGAAAAPAPPAPVAAGDEPHVTLAIAAHREGDVIAAKVADARAVDWPAERLEVLVACDGSPDDTAERAREAGADVVLELPWGGKVRAQDAAVRAADPRSTIIAFSDANSSWDPDALRALVGRLRSAPDIAYACGQVRFVNPDGDTNQEGLYWRMEMWIRALESRLASVTGGNGAIYALRREDYLEVDPVMGHDLAFPFNLVKRGRRAVYEPAARATEKMVPSIEGEWTRKRRMMTHAWPIVVRGGMLSPRGYGPLRADDRLAPGAALRHAVAARAALVATRRCCRAGARTSWRAAPDGAARRRGGGRSRAVAAAARRALLRPHERVGRRRAVRLAAVRQPSRLGAAGGHALMRRVFDVASRTCGLLRAAPPLLARPRSRSGSRSTGTPIYRQRRVGLDGVAFDVSSCARWSAAPSARQGPRRQRGRQRITRVGRWLRRTSLDEVPNLDQRAARRDVDGRPAADGPGPGRPLRATASATAWPRPARHHGLGAGQRPRSLPWNERIELDLWYVEHRSWPLDLKILWRSVRIVFGGDGLYRGDGPAWGGRA